MTWINSLLPFSKTRSADKECTERYNGLSIANATGLSGCGSLFNAISKHAALTGIISLLHIFDTYCDCMFFNKSQATLGLAAIITLEEIMLLPSDNNTFHRLL